MELTKTKLKEILDNAPQDIPKNAIVQRLLDKGYKIEGLENNIENIQKKPEGVSGLKGVAVGFGKGVLSTLKGAGELGTKILEQVPGRFINLTEGKGFTPTEIENVYTQEYPALKAKGGAEKLGKFVENVAEFAIPGTKLAKATKGAGIAKKALLEGAVSGGVTAIQQGGVNKDVRDNAIISAVFPVLGKGITSIKNVLRSPENGARVVNSLVKPLLKDFSYGKNPGRAVAEEGIVASNLDELSEKIMEKRQNIGRQINDLLSTNENLAKKIDLFDIIEPLNEASVKARQAPRTNSQIIDRLRDITSDILGETVDDKGNPVYTRTLKGLSPLQATEFKRLLGDITKFTGNASDDKAVNSALKKMYGIVKEKINEAVPEIKTLNEKYADLTSAEIATKYRDKILERQNLIKLSDTTAGLGGALITAITTGGATIPALIAGATAVSLKKALESTKVKTQLASWLAKASKQEKQKLINATPWIKGVLLETYGNMFNEKQ